MKATYHHYFLNFKNPSGTSRGVLSKKETWFIIIENGQKKGIGECGLLRGLSCDDRDDYEEKLAWACANIQLGLVELWEALIEFPSIQFGLEIAFLSLESNSPFELFPSDFTLGKAQIEINGLVWMGDKDFMKQQIESKIEAGFKCIKLKIGAIDFDKEVELLNYIRANFSSKEVEIRVDANGAFDQKNALDKINQIAVFELHSIEQPIKTNQHNSLSDLCMKSPLPIALDEELIGIFKYEEKELLLKKIKPQYIILKPSFIGGFRGTKEWIALAENHGIGWWVTSALESNIGLNAIAQWTFLQNNIRPQGLGTGELYSNNIECPLVVSDGKLGYDQAKKWELDSSQLGFYW